jgi:hypothetical protein
VPHEEKYGSRDRSYSAWHRRLSTRRFIGIERAQLLAMIDLDASLYVEYDDGTKEPLALIETARDVGQDYKTATVTKKLAERANMPCFVLLYTIGTAPNPADHLWPDITSFRVKRLWPKPEFQWRTVTPEAWANTLLRLRAKKLDDADARENKLPILPVNGKSHFEQLLENDAGPMW